MITSRRDYIVRLIEEVGRLLSRVMVKRRKGESDDSALGTVVFGFERLFRLDADQIFLLSPDQQYDLLIDEEFPEFARDKVLMYAALSVEAGHIYARGGQPAMARATFINALRFTLKARAQFSTDALPSYTPSVPDLLALLQDAPLDPETAALLSGSSANQA
jgi:hypothetical protein